MVIQCPSCQARYRIQKEKLPAGGGNIKCPSCSHVFAVHADDENSSLGADSSLPEAPPPIPAAAPAAAATSAVRWKVRNDIGLVFDFTDNDQLRRWLSSRDNLDTLTASIDGGTTWKGLHEFPEIADIRGGGRPRTMMGMSAVGLSEAATAALRESGNSASTAPPSAEQLREQAKERLEAARRERMGDDPPVATPPPKRPPSFKVVRTPKTAAEADTSKAIYVLSALLLPLFAAIALHMAGVINLNQMIDGITPQPEQTPEPVPPPARSTLSPNANQDPAAAMLDPNANPGAITDLQRLQLARDQASAAEADGDLSTAAAQYERIIFLQPTDTTVACRLGQIYTTLNRPQEAARANARCPGANAPAQTEEPGDQEPGDEATEPGTAPSDGPDDAPPAP